MKDNEDYDRVDLCSMYEPICEPPAYLLEKWRRVREHDSPFRDYTERKIGNTIYLVETECIAYSNESLESKIRRLIFSDKGGI